MNSYLIDNKTQRFSFNATETCSKICNKSTCMNTRELLNFWSTLLATGPPNLEMAK